MHMKIYFAVFVFSTLRIQDILSKPTSTLKCPHDLLEVECLVDPCKTSACAGDPTAICLSNYCGGCNAIWLSRKGGLAECNTKSETTPCQEVQCFVNPCQNRECLGYPEAVCVPNYCGGCHFNWYDSDGDELNCPTDI